jgi:hypothetical protein
MRAKLDMKDADGLALVPITYDNLNARQKEAFNFQKVAALLANYGFNCIKLADDWQGADFLAYHNDGEQTLKVQLKGRLTINKKYLGKQIYMAFPMAETWYLVPHDKLVELVKEHTKWIGTRSWSDISEDGHYHSPAPPKNLTKALIPFQLKPLEVTKGKNKTTKELKN